MKRARGGQWGFSLIQVSIGGLLLAILSLGFAEIMAWMTKSSRYNKVYNTRNALDNTLKNAVINPRILCKSIDTALATQNAAAGNNLFSACVVGKPDGSVTNCKDRGPAPGVYNQQPVALWDASGTTPLSGRYGVAPGSSPGSGLVNEPLHLDAAGVPCPVGTTDYSSACPFRVKSWFVPTCAETGPFPCLQAAYVTVFYEIEIFPNIEGGAPLAKATNSGGVPIESWKIAAACPTAATQPAQNKCPPGSFVVGIDPTKVNQLICGPATATPAGPNANACPLGQAQIGYNDDWTPRCVRPQEACPTATGVMTGIDPSTDPWTPVCKNTQVSSCAAGSFLSGIDTSTDPWTATCRGTQVASCPPGQFLTGINTATDPWTRTCEAPPAGPPPSPTTPPTGPPVTGVHSVPYDCDVNPRSAAAGYGWPIAATKISTRYWMASVVATCPADMPYMIEKETTCGLGVLLSSGYGNDWLKADPATTYATWNGYPPSQNISGPLAHRLTCISKNNKGPGPEGFADRVIAWISYRCCKYGPLNFPE